MPHVPSRLVKIGTATSPKWYICNSSPLMTGGTMVTATLVEPRPDDLQEAGQEAGSTELTSAAPSLGMTIDQPVVGNRIASLMDAQGAGS